MATAEKTERVIHWIIFDWVKCLSWNLYNVANLTRAYDNGYNDRGECR